MKHKFSVVALAAASLTLTVPTLAQAQDGTMSQPAQSDTAPPRGQHLANRMVPTRAALTNNLDSAKSQAGTQFKATLTQKTQLIDGPELPSGTLLIGTVAEDDQNLDGKGKLVLRFTEADLKDGTIIPIRATIVGAYSATGTDGDGDPVKPGQEVANNWNDNILRVDQMGLLHGLDLHSAIASKNSGVFVSTKKSTVSLDRGTELAIAIAIKRAPQQPMETAPTN